MRRGPSPKHPLNPDPKYGNAVLAKFINYVMEDGKKLIAQKIVYKAFELIEKKTGKNPLDIFDEAVKNVMPLVEVRGRRIGGANYQIPIPVRGERKYALAFRWMLLGARTKKKRAMFERLADELIAAAQKEGDAMKKRNDVHRMAEANRAFAHFARFSR